ncbi:MAG: hypothetical protein RR461_03075 [Angelakisella sp.]
MGESRCRSNIRLIHRFLNATDANWRNSIYIECAVCKFGIDQTTCGDFLFAPDEDGTPLLIPVCDAEILAATVIDKSECLGIVTNLRFENLFGKWFRGLGTDHGLCPYLQAIKKLHPPEKW